MFHHPLSSSFGSRRIAPLRFRPPSLLSPSSAARCTSAATKSIRRTRPRLRRSDNNRWGPSQFVCFSSLLRSLRVEMPSTTSTMLASPARRISVAANRCRIPVAGCRPRMSQPQQSRRGGARRTNSTTSSDVAATESKARIPSLRTLRWVAFTTGLPFIGFGFMDNAILIIAGDYIDTSLGVTLGISTMCAAAIGNIISDLAGIGCAAYIEDFCAVTLKLPVPKLSGAQRQLRSVRMASQGGMAIGMTIGCLLGMVPLLFIDSNRADKLRERARLERLYKDVLTEAKTLVEAESTCLWLRVDRDRDEPSQSWRRDVGILPDNYHPSVSGDYLYAMYYVEPPKYSNNVSITTDTLMRMVSGGSRGTPRRSDGSLQDTSPGMGSKSNRGLAEDTTLSHRGTQRVIPLGKGIVSRAVTTGTTWNIAGDLMDEDDFYPLSLETAGSDYKEQIDRERYRDAAVVPILDGRGRVIAVLEALNKERSAERYDDYDEDDCESNDELVGFTDQDVEILVSLASHVSVSLQRTYQIGEEDEEDFGLRDTIRILKEGKGMKRSITRRQSVRLGAGGTSGGASRNGTKTTQERKRGSSTTAEKKNMQLFPESLD